ncbi:LacI family transcriptional regulator [Alicyclobacillus fastidiosus]|uniref:LacI family transcriptional regulator n=1 Tax=Alicyclobacillus fastidiosus TaxID=392011 RepID=A0ABY6ZD55_9BACL|nr:LacI family DNA-binding transcriptional regulator [Alicyclobacillus fastidiosus]WAH40675.1 LacI family transcriptional regulator [Alicyclobacillus fastidiosus]GMA62138.1 LacI family transcriptional regulator [Alicyclobacillus fastidiosus]
MSTIKDVAKEAGVSVATVSHVLNRTRFVSPETAQKVMKAVESLNFNLNPVARNLRASRSKIIGVLIPDLYGSFFTDLIRAIERKLESVGYDFFLFHTDRDAKREERYLHQLIGYKVDGLIVAVTEPTENHPTYKWVEEQGLPIVYVDRVPPVGITGTVVTTNNYEATKSAVSHLFQSYDEVVMITSNQVASPIKERETAYIDVCKEQGFRPIIASTDGWGADVGYEQTGRILHEINLRPFGIFCVTNSVLRGTFQRLKEEKINIPNEVGIIGFDDAPWTTLVTPEVTVVRSKPAEIGHLAVRRLMEQLDGNKTFEPAHDLITAELVVRDSSIIT